MILTFVLGAALGVLGLVGADGSGVLRYIFSEQNLLADKVIITKTFLGREKNVKPINPLNLVKRIGINKAEYIEDFNQITGKIAKKAKKGDVVVVFGAGKSYLLSRQIKEKLKNL